jgi:hypothetical protein
MIKIKFFSNFCSSAKCSLLFSKSYNTELDSYYGNKYIFTENNDYTHAIILNTVMPLLTIPKENVLGLACEPIEYLFLTYEFIDYAKKNIGTYYIGTKYNLPEPFVEYYSFLWHSTPLIKQPDISIKTKIMSIIFSEKKDAPGHKYRHIIVERILKSKLPIDIFGRGCELYKDNNDIRIKGSFKESEPYIDYKYHITIENFRHNSYVSEKFTNSIIYGCTQLYLGAYKIDDYFPNSCFKLSGNIENDMKLIEGVCTGKLDIIKKNINYPNNMKLTEHIKNKYLSNQKYSIITGASSNHKKSLYQFINSIYKNITIPIDIYVYDLGLDIDFINILLSKFPKIIFKKFDYSKYPEYYNININAGEYAWKPAIIKEIADITTGYIIWCDAGNIIKDNFNLDNIKHILDIYKIYSPLSGGIISEWTHKLVIDKFNIINNDNILNERNKNGAILAFNLNHDNVREFINDFAQKASIREYIAPYGSNRLNHRQDQALFTILYYYFCYKYKLEYISLNLGISIHNDCD